MKSCQREFFKTKRFGAVIFFITATWYCAKLRKFMGWDVPGGTFFELLESPDTSYAPLLSIPSELTYSVLIFPWRPLTRVIDNLSRLVSSCPVERQVDVMSKKKASVSDQSDDDDDDSVTEDRANTNFIPTLDIFNKANAIKIQPINSKGGHSYLFDGDGKCSLIFSLVHS